MTKTIVVIVTPNGETKVETKGFSGSKCQEASRFLETALGEKTSEKLTAEFHETISEQQNHLQQET